MSTQDATGINFSVVPEDQQQHFRLLELPPELLELLTSEDAPALHLKSLETPPGQPTEQNAVLCTPDKTYNLRQVNTSNSLFLTEISETGPQDELPTPRLQAIAQSHFTLELLPSKDASAAEHIQAILPVYTETGLYQSHTVMSKAQLFSNIPTNNVECERAWCDLACFEQENEAFIPSSNLKLKVWEAILSEATAESIDLTAILEEKQLDTLWHRSGHEWSDEISIALLRSMAQHSNEEEYILDEKKCARAVGQALLKDRTERSAMPKGAFISAWADLLPEKWRSSAELKLLEGSYGLADGQIRFYDAANDSSGSKAPAEAKSGVGAKRKWHEKFRAQKKTV